jgi:hypothetical protein
MTARTRVTLKFDDDVLSGATKIDNSPVIPNGQTWRVSRLICAHADDGSHISGGFQLEWGEAGSWEFVSAAYLTGDTKEYAVKKDFTGDGTKTFRIIRQNLDGAKLMIRAIRYSVLSKETFSRLMITLMTALILKD